MPRRHRKRHDQTGNFKIDARFNKKTLLERLRLIRLYASRISVRCSDGVAIIEEFADNQTSFIYADPPYFMKAGSLYLNSFKYDDHANLANCLNQLAKSANWILTYDNVPEVVALYSDRRRIEVGVNYSARHVVRAKEILVCSDKVQLEQQSLWDYFPSKGLQDDDEQSPLSTSADLVMVTEAEVRTYTKPRHLPGSC